MIFVFCRLASGSSTLPEDIDIRRLRLPRREEDATNVQQMTGSDVRVDFQRREGENHTWVKQRYGGDMKISEKVLEY